MLHNVGALRGVASKENGSLAGKAPPSHHVVSPYNRRLDNRSQGPSRPTRDCYTLGIRDKRELQHQPAHNQFVNVLIKQQDSKQDLIMLTDLRLQKAVCFVVFVGHFCP